MSFESTQSAPASVAPAEDPDPASEITAGEPRLWGRDTLALMLGVLVLGLGFILSYVGAFHQPRPHRVSVAVVAPAGQSLPLLARLNALPGGPLSARPVAGRVAATRLVRRDQAAAALLVSGDGHSDRLLVAGGGGSALSAAVQSVVSSFDAQQKRTVAVTDLEPLQSGDYHGLTGFYLVVGWLVAGYLLAAILGIKLGPRAPTRRHAASRLLAGALYSVAAGIGGAVIVGPLLGALTGHFFAVAGVGSLLVFAAASVTIALEASLGIAGIGLAILIYVVLGNPSAGGAYQNQLLPGFWRAIGNALPNGAGVDTIRRIEYFGGHGITTHLIVIAAYCLVATSASLLLARRRSATPNTHAARGPAHTRLAHRRAAPRPGDVMPSTRPAPHSHPTAAASKTGPASPPRR
jgi:hypothetical protein